MKLQKSLIALSILVGVPTTFAQDDTLSSDNHSPAISQQDFVQQAIAEDQKLSDSEFNSTQSSQLNSLGYRSISTNSSLKNYV